MAHHEVAEVDVKKELLFSLVGIVAFATVVAFIGISAFLRPAGEHPNLAQLNADTASVATTSQEQSADPSTKPEVAQDAKDNVASAAAQIEAKTGEAVNVEAPVASASK